MISKQEVADYINANVETLLTAEEIKILEDSIKNHPGKFMITDILIEEGHAVKYHGQNKADVLAMHLANRNMLMENGTVDPKDVQEAEKNMK